MFAGGRIDAIILSGGAVHRTAQPTGIAEEGPALRRTIEADALRVEHVLFAPSRPRPLRLSLVQLRNAGSDLLIADYTETWDLARSGYRVGEAAAIAETSDGPRVLADASAVPRARPPREPPALGLALDVRLALPPGARRPLCFAYVAPGPDDEPAALVRAWRGDVAAELERSLQAWRTSESS
jgi:hypothetical protein